MRVDPLEISVKRRHERLDRPLECLFGEEDPVRRGQRLRDLARVDRTDDDRDDPLPGPDCMTELLLADVGDDRVRADDEDERLCSLDSRIDLAPPVRRRRDVLPIDPGVLAVLAEGRGQATDERDVMPRVRNEEVRPLGDLGLRGGDRVRWRLARLPRH